MPIEFQCQSCGVAGKIPDQYAGRRIRCPKCKAVNDIPPASDPEPAAADAQPATEDTPVGTKWLVRIPGGDIYGPVPREELDAWFAEGRVSAQCQLAESVEEGSEQWRPAAELYPELAGDQA